MGKAKIGKCDKAEKCDKDDKVKFCRIENKIAADDIKRVSAAIQNACCRDKKGKK